MITRPYPKVNGLKTIPFPATHTRIANIWEHHPPGYRVRKLHGKGGLVLLYTDLCSWLALLSTQGPHSRILMTGGGGVRVIFLRFEILAKSDFLGSMKDAGILLDHEKKPEEYFGIPKKGLRDFCGYAKKSSDFFWVDKF